MSDPTAYNLPDDAKPQRGGNRRRPRLESLLRREIATMVTQELRDPRLGFVTITRCEMSDDLSMVTAYFTVLGTPGQRNLAHRALDAAVHYIQRGYAKLVKMRRLPVLRFRYDEREQQAQDLDRLIGLARSTDPKPAPEPEMPEPADDESAT